MAATRNYNTPERVTEVYVLPVAAATHIYAGTLVAVNSSGNAVPAADSSGLLVVGRAEEEVNNTGSAGDLTILVKRGVFAFDNYGSDLVDGGDRQNFCYVYDDHTVRAAGGSNNIRAGLVAGLDTDGRVWVDTRLVVHPAGSVADGAVTLAKLAAGVSPGLVAKLGAVATMSGGNASEAVTISGVAATDNVQATITDNGSNNDLQLLEAKPTTNTVTLLFNEDPTAGVKVSIVAFRAAS